MSYRLADCRPVLIFLSVFEERERMCYTVSLPLRHMHMFFDEATCIIYCDRETRAGGFRNVFSQMWSLLRSLFSLVPASEDTVGNENVRSMSVLRQFGFGLLHTGLGYLIATHYLFNSKSTHTHIHTPIHTRKLKVILNGLGSLSFSPSPQTLSSLFRLPTIHSTSPLPTL